MNKRIRRSKNKRHAVARLINLEHKDVHEFCFDSAFSLTRFEVREITGLNLAIDETE